jgi:branched-chain amino acid transport system ATP-binding protein
MAAAMSLQVQQLVKHFDGVKAVNGVSFDLGAGECVALIGPNGAGKSTCFACIAGQHMPTSGQILWHGQRLDRLSVQARLQAGVARTFQVAQTFEALTVLQNVQLTIGRAKKLSAWRSINTQHPEAARALLDKLGLLNVADADVLGLPYGAKKRLELAIALAGLQGAGGVGGAGASQQLLLLDEPAAGLAGPERAQLMQLVKSLAKGAESKGTESTGGIAVLYTEHNMDAVFGVADRVLVLIDGQLAAQGTPSEVAQDATVRERYLGKAFHA